MFLVTATLVFTLSQAQFCSKHFPKSTVVGAVTFLVTAILVFTLSQAQFFYNTKGPLTLLKCFISSKSFNITRTLGVS